MNKTQSKWKNLRGVYKHDINEILTKWECMRQVRRHAKIHDLH